MGPIKHSDTGVVTPGCVCSFLHSESTSEAHKGQEVIKDAD